MTAGRAFSILVLAILCGVTSISQASDETNELIDKALQSSGVAGQLETLFQAVLAAVPDGAYPGPKVKRSARSFMKKAAGRDSLLPLISDSLRMDFRRDLIEQVIAFYKSPLGDEVGRITEKSCTPKALSAVRRNRARVASISERRLRAIERILEAQRVVEFNGRLLSAMIRGLADVSLAKGTDSDLRSRNLWDKLESVEIDLRSDEEQAWALGLVACENTFRSLNDEEMEQLAEFYESEAGRWFVGRVQEGLEVATQKAARALASVLNGMNRQDKDNDSRP